MKKYIRENKKIIFIVSIIICCFFILLCHRNKLVLVSYHIKIEYGQNVSTSVKDYLDYEKTEKSDLHDIIKNTNEEDNLKYSIKDENGKMAEKQNEYPQVGYYQIIFTYKNEKKRVIIEVKDTTKTKIKAPSYINIPQNADISTDYFKKYLTVTDYSKIKDWDIDTSQVNTHKPGEYIIKISVSDEYNNTAFKELKIHVVKAEDNQVSIKESDTKVTNNNSDKTTNSSLAHHRHHWVEKTKTIHHEAQTKTVHHEAETKKETVTVVDQEAYDEPVFETRYICNLCGYSTKDGRLITDHTLDICHCGYHSGKVQVGSIHHDALSHQENEIVVVKPAYDETVIIKKAYDEIVVIGYQCNCGAVKEK